MQAAVSLRGFERDGFSGQRDASVRFGDMRAYLTALGFHERVRGSHHVFWHPDVPEILNLQPERSSCKRCQVRQVRRLLEAHNMRL